MNRSTPEFNSIFKIPKDNVPKRIYQLKIRLMNIKPPIWRRILVSNYTYFSEVNDLIQEYFNWGGYHLHEFYFKHPNILSSKIYIQGVIDWDVDSVEADYYHFRADQIRLCDVFSETLRKVYYIYDFGDYWEHIISLEKVFPWNKELKYPLCVGGKRAAPPEDSGGAYGYEEKVKVLRDPTHKDYEEILEWVGTGFDPDEFFMIDVKMSPKMIEKEFGPSLDLTNLNKKP